jgi:ABC-type transport system involved in cytochrome bd biosynthesis fused ATPase/permease subunit
MNKKFFKLFFIVDTIVVVICLLLQKYLWLLNIQIAFISSLIITIGSFYGYKKNIQNRVNLTDNQFLNNTADTIDKIDDPYDLYSDDIKQTQENKISKTINNIKQTTKNTIKSFGAFGSLYRVVGYVVLIIGFFYLNNNQLLNPIAYLIGLIITPIIVLLFAFLNRKN